MKNTPSNPTTFRRLRRLTSTLLALGVFAGTIAGAAQPVHAASWVSGCFTLGGRAPAYPISVELRVYTARGWIIINNGYKTSSDGCVRIPMTLGYNGYYAMLYANDRNYGGTLYGWSGRYALPGNQQAGVGSAALQYSCAGIVSDCR